MYGDDGYQAQIPTSEKELPPLRSEVVKAHSRVKNNKAAGPDNIPVELLKARRNTVVDKLHEMILSAWENGEWPQEWMETMFVPLHKKGSRAVLKLQNDSTGITCKQGSVQNCS